MFDVRLTMYHSRVVYGWDNVFDLRITIYDVRSKDPRRQSPCLLVFQSPCLLVFPLDPSTLDSSTPRHRKSEKRKGTAYAVPVHEDIAYTTDPSVWL
ncbi:MAG: hypothetical protein J4G05_11575, partial [Chlorobi bacterium]|nr:hypothetical protein [Chlorobiota bacterium]